MSENFPCDIGISFERIGEGGALGVVTLDAPARLNSLDLEVIDAMSAQLSTWQDDPQVQAVLLRGRGPKIFCAGGDVIRLYHSMCQDRSYALHFFKREYQLDLLIHQYQKPLICLASGITMGGGIGIMNGASHRVVSETTKMAMPEITIGLFPDVGGSYFLNQMPGRIGLYLGLTGTRFNGAEAIFLSMADYFIPTSKFAELTSKLQEIPWSDPTQRASGHIQKLLDTYHEKNTSSQPANTIAQHQEEIEWLMEGINIGHIATKFEKERANHQSHPWIAAGVQTFLKGSPTSAAIIFEQFMRGKQMTLPDALEQELIMAQQCVHQSDFTEGVRALLIDKDNSPRWRPSSLEDITPEMVKSYFVPQVK